MYKRTTDATSEVITTAEAKSHLRVSVDTDDDLIDDLIKAARQWTENYTRRALLTQTWELTMDGFPDSGEVVYLERSPVASVTSLKYYDTDDTEQTWGTSNYNIDTNSTPGRISEDVDVSWPSTSDRKNAVKVTFVAGDTTAASVPLPIKQAMLIHISHNYDNRGDEGHRKYPQAIFDLLEPYRVFKF